MVSADFQCVCLWQSVGPVPGDFELVGARKGFNRYRSERQKGLVAALAAAQDQREAALSSILQVCARPGRMIPTTAMLAEVHCWLLGVRSSVDHAGRQTQQALWCWLQGLLERFAAHHDLWVASLQQAAQLDALASLALAAELACAHGPVCRPHIISDAGAQPVRTILVVLAASARASTIAPCVLRCRACLPLTICDARAADLQRSGAAPPSSSGHICAQRHPAGRRAGALHASDWRKHGREVHLATPGSLLSLLQLC